jgi:selenocysteine lyase/cysteine desulfurase
LAPVPYRFEAGMPLLSSASALVASLQNREFPLPSSSAAGGSGDTSISLCITLTKRLSSVLGARVYSGGAGNPSGIVSFSIPGASSESVADRLRERGFVVDAGRHGYCAFHAHVLGVEGTVRVVLGATELSADDIESFVGAVRDALGAL